jgi:Tfp pilus assembly pilus retraction ATPase PilT
MPTERLRGFVFMDLYISSDPLSPPMIRGLRHRRPGPASIPKGVTKIPAILLDDVSELQEAIVRKWRKSGKSREFTVSHDGIGYRCALIAPPEKVFQIPDEFAEVPALSWCVRQLDGRIPSLDELCSQASTREAIRSLSGHRGLVIVSGPFASGKTTLASSMFDGWVRETREVGVTLEDPPELPLARVSETEGVIYQIDLMDRSIREAIKSSRRWSPRYVFLGEVRTPDVCAELLHMSISGPLAVCTIHASNPVQAIVSLFRFAAGAMSEEMARDMISASLVHVFHQELRGERAILKSIHLHGADNQLLRSKIRSGNFGALHEDFDRQISARSPA